MREPSPELQSKLLKGGYRVISGITIGAIKGDTRSLDYSSLERDLAFGDMGCCDSLLQAPPKKENNFATEEVQGLPESHSGLGFRV